MNKSSADCSYLLPSESESGSPVQLYEGISVSMSWCGTSKQHGLIAKIKQRTRDPRLHTNALLTEIDRLVTI